MRNYICPSLHGRSTRCVTSGKTSKGTVNNLTMNRPARGVCRVVRIIGRVLPGSGPHCLVKINAPMGVLRNVRHNMSVFSYMVPAQGKHGKVLFAGGNVVGVHGGG